MSCLRLVEYGLNKIYYRTAISLTIFKLLTQKINNYIVKPENKHQYRQAIDRANGWTVIYKYQIHAVSERP